MPKNRRPTVIPHDRKTIAFWSFMAVALVVGLGLYWATSVRATGSDSDYASAYIPAPNAAPIRPAVELARVDGVLDVRYIGDSLTDGWNAARQPESFRPLVTTALQNNGPVQESGVYRAGARLAEVAAMTTPHPGGGLLIIELGTNDTGKTPLPEFTADYEKLLTVQSAKDSVLICVGVYQSGTTGGFDDAISKSCAAHGGTFVRISDLKTSAATIAPAGDPAYPMAADGYHPNSAGHAEIARRILAGLDVQ